MRKATSKKAKFNEFTGLPYLPEDLQMRLSRSVVRYKGKPVFVDEVNCFDITECSLYVTRLEDSYTFTIKLPSEDLDVRPVPLGYININGRSLYAARKPHRRYKQGLCKESLTVHRDRLLDLSRLLKSRELAQCIRGEYPTFQYALDSVQAGMDSRAFSRRFSLLRDRRDKVLLECRGETVGHYEDKLILDDSYTYLREELEAAI